MLNGARGPKVIEHQAVHRIYSVQWKRPEINLMELAKLRWLEKWSVARLSRHFDRKPDTIQMHLCRLRKVDLCQMGFTRSEVKIITQASKQVFRGI